MSSPSSPLITLDVAHRPAEVWIGRAALVFAALCPWVVSTFAPVECFLLSVVLTAVVATGLMQSGWLGRRLDQIVSLSWLADGRWMARRRDGRVLECELCLNSRVVAGCVWLQLRAIHAPRRARSLLLVQPHTRADALRRLIVRLRVDVPRGGAALPLPR